jgi:hypothetical protein
VSARPNAELAWRVLDHIDAHPEQWDQGKWIGRAECGTVACFAGWTVMLSGGAVYTSSESVTILGRPELEGLHIEQAAQRLLGVRGDVMVLHGDPFDGLLTRAELGERVEAIFGPRPAWTAADETAWRECAHRADYLTPAHHARECAYHRGEVDEWGQPVDDVPPNAGSAS